MSFNIRNSITPEKPILVVYNNQTNQLGLSADGWDLVCVINWVPFVRHQPHADDYESYYGTPFGAVPMEGIVDKSVDWTVVGEF